MHSQSYSFVSPDDVRRDIRTANAVRQAKDTRAQEGEWMTTRTGSCRPTVCLLVRVGGIWVGAAG